MIGRVFNNRYQITERIGIGGMAEVFRAQDRVLGRLVAVKVMLPQYAADPDFTQRFRQEAASAANLQSPYIVNVYDWGQDEGTYFIVMEYVRGSDLKTAIKQRGAINQRKVAEIGAQVCQALSVAHNQDIIHRDIKPQNIMVQPDGNVKVMDFGIARAKNSVKSQTSAVLGTAHYISPEQAQGKELTPASDIYSLGIVMYEAATGSLPFDAPDAVSVATKQVNELPAPPHEVKPDIDPNLEAIIMRALEKDPMNRFATATDMKHAINDYLAGRSLDFTNAETQVMNGAYPAEGTSVMPAVGAAERGAQSTHRNVSTADPEEEKKASRKKKIIIAIVAILAIALIAGIVFAINGANSGNGKVPDVTGKTVSEATTMIQSSGYTVGSTTQVYSDSIPSGSIVSTDPNAGVSAAKGSKVNLNVSKGKEQVEVPDLYGMSASEAEQALNKAGLKGKQSTSQHSDSAPANTVMDQDIASGTKADKNTVITYTISLGPDTVSVPDVRGQKESTATTSLKNSGFSVQTYKDYSDTVDEGLVIDQTPSSGTKVDKGATISLTISMGAKPKETFTVSASGTPTAGGSVSVSKSSVTSGGSFTYSITVNSGYTIASVVDSRDGNLGTSANGTVSNVTESHTITVTFTQTSTSSTSGNTTNSTGSNTGGTTTGGTSTTTKTN
jgi:serine/threonine-protein kinase